MKINRLLLIALAAVLSFLVLAACNSAVTENVHPTAEPTATPDPLISMDPADRAFLLYDRWSNLEISSYKCFRSLQTRITDDETVRKSTESEIVTFNRNTNDFVEHISTKSFVGDDMAAFQESGYANGYKFIKSDTTSIKAPVSAEQYILEAPNSRLMEILRPTREKCSKVSSIINGDGNWKVYFEGYSPEVCQKVFEELLGESATYDEDTMGHLEIVYAITLTEGGYPVAVHLAIGSNREDESDVTVDALYRIFYRSVNRVKEAPEVDLSQYEEVTSIED